MCAGTSTGQSCYTMVLQTALCHFSYLCLGRVFSFLPSSATSPAPHQAKPPHASLFHLLAAPHHFGTFAALIATALAASLPSTLVCHLLAAWCFHTLLPLALMPFPALRLPHQQTLPLPTRFFRASSNPLRHLLTPPHTTCLASLRLLAPAAFPVKKKKKNTASQQLVLFRLLSMCLWGRCMPHPR